MSTVSMDRVSYDECGEPFISYYNTRYRNNTVRVYGAIRNCVVCGSEFFEKTDHTKSRIYCSVSCSRRRTVLDAYKSVKRVVYKGNCSWAYIAGFLDGEGSVIKYKNTIRISMAQKDIAVLREIQGFLLSNVIESYIAASQRCYCLLFSNPYAVYRFVMKVQNHSFVKLDKLWDARAILWEKIKR